MQNIDLRFSACVLEVRGQTKNGYLTYINYMLEVMVDMVYVKFRGKIFFSLKMYIEFLRTS